MTAHDDLSQRVQFAQQRVVETAPSGERDSVAELTRKKVRFAERVEERTPEGTVTEHQQQFEQQFQFQFQFQFQQQFDHNRNIDAGR